jgi:tripartite-type tricarboxylate transporter receptor subunit TctC
LAVPSGTPEPVAALLEREIHKALTSPDIQARLLPMDMKVVASTSIEAKSRIQSDAALWARVVKATGMHVD